MFTKILDWLAGLIPAEYSVGVAIKKVSYLAGKLLVGFVVGKLAVGRVTPDQVVQIELAVTTAVALGLEGIHDWARVKYPDVKWL